MDASPRSDFVPAAPRQTGPLGHGELLGRRGRLGAGAALGFFFTPGKARLTLPELKWIFRFHEFTVFSRSRPASSAGRQWRIG